MFFKRLVFAFRVQLLHMAIWYSVYDFRNTSGVMFTAPHNGIRSQSFDYILKTEITRSSSRSRGGASFVCSEESVLVRFTRLQLVTHKHWFLSVVTSTYLDMMLPIAPHANVNLTLILTLTLKSSLEPQMANWSKNWSQFHSEGTKTDTHTHWTISSQNSLPRSSISGLWNRS